MELHKALQQIIRTDGRAVLTQPRLVNILSDLQAYQAIPAAKYIIASMINDGYMQKLLQIGKWDGSSERLVNQFVQMTGFQHDMVSRIFQSVAYGLCWKKSIDVVSPPNNPPAQTPPQSGSVPPGANDLMLTYSELKKKSESFRFDYTQKAIKYVNSLIEIKGNWRVTIGLDPKASVSYELDEYGNNYLEFHLEINGTMKLQYAYLVLVVYNHQGKIVTTDRHYIEKSRSSFRVVDFSSVEINKFKCVGNISKVVIYWEEY